MRKIKVGLLGFGTVGQGMVRVLREASDVLASKLKFDISLVAIADLDIETDRGIPLGGIRLTTDAKEVISDPKIDLVVELIGGLEPARSYILEALERGKHVVTANKALLAEHGPEIFSRASQKGLCVAFEAAVAGGIPIVRALRDGLVAERLRSIFGIINGTANYILSEMTDKGSKFSDVLRLAQKKGYAEADPSLDVEGLDSAHKLVILILLGFGTEVKLSQIFVEGISRIAPVDIQFAKELGYRIKLLAIAKQEGGFLEARVHPTMIPANSLLATVSGIHNAIFIKGEATGSTMFYGQGAGMMPTGCAVVADVVEVASMINSDRPLAWRPCQRDLSLRNMAETVNHYYLRFSAVDRPGVLSKIAGVLGDHDISIASVIQKGRQVGPASGGVPVVMMTHEAREKNVRAALKLIDQLPVVRGDTLLIRVEENLD